MVAKKCLKNFPVNKIGVAICVLFFSAAFTAREDAAGKSIRVSTLSDLARAIDDAMPGDTIILAKGKYTANDDIIIGRSGTKGRPVVITAEIAGESEITGVGGFRIARPASYIVIRGFRFTHAAAHAKSEPGTSFCRWTQNIFETPGKGDYLNISGDDHQIDHNTFQNKDSMGKFIAVRGEGSQIARRLWIHHNYFNHFVNQGGPNGAEALQFGLSGFSLSSSNSILEYNLFEDCAGENELISVKASEVVLRYNTIRDCPAQFTLRHGNRCQVYGNYFFNTPGLRIFGDDHIVHSNYFQNCSMALNVGNGDGEVADGAKLTSHDRPDRVLIAFNTLVGNTRNIVQTGRKNGLGATEITIAWNIIQGGGPAAEISAPYKDGVWKGNMVFHTANAGDMPREGFRTADPLLKADASGIVHLQDDSPARDIAIERFSSVTVDMDGQPRSSPLDAGADEISSAPMTAGPLRSGDVGFAALR